MIASRGFMGGGRSLSYDMAFGGKSFAPGEELVSESIIGTRFQARIVDETEVAGVPAAVPEITGRAWITGMAQYLLDPDDPFPAGFDLR